MLKMAPLLLSGACFAAAALACLLALILALKSIRPLCGMKGRLCSFVPSRTLDPMWASLTGFAVTRGGHNTTTSGAASQSGPLSGAISPLSRTCINARAELKAPAL